MINYDIEMIQSKKSFFLSILINITSIFNETLQRKNFSFSHTRTTIEFFNYQSYFICQKMIFQVQIGRLQSAIITTASQQISILSMMSEKISKQHL